MTSTLLLRRLRILLGLLLIVNDASAQNLSLPRWGQATAIVNDVLFIHGGKTDQDNGMTYTSAETNNDLFTLDLTRDFDASSPPWVYVGGSSNTSSNQGPMLAWHTASAFNFTDLLVFGGDGGPNSPIVSPDQPDSALLLDIDNEDNPNWISNSPSWASEPVRRIHHAASSSNGRIWITGGEEDDGSGIGYSQHYMFDPTVPTFSQLPSDNGPPDIYGHTSVVLSNGTMLVMGGYSQSEGQLIPFTTIWSLDTTQSNLAWSTMSVSGTSVPPPRRAFAAVVLPNDQILIHGGADAVLSTSYSDGWILDTSTFPMTWSNVSALARLGPRRDHFAVLASNQVIFGFGYAINFGSSPVLELYDLDSSSFTPSFTAPTVLPTSNTLPVPTNRPTGTNTNGNGSPTQSGHGSGWPTGSDSGSSTGVGSGGGQPTTTSVDPNDPDNSDTTTHQVGVLAITLGTIFGVSALAAGVFVVYIYRRRGRGSRNERFVLITNEDVESPAIAFGGGFGSTPSGLEKVRRFVIGVSPDWTTGWNMRSLGRRRGESSNNTLDAKKRTRFDMLADEDEREFDDLTFAIDVRRDGSGSSRSWYSGHGRDGSANARPVLANVISGSLNSLRSVGAMIGIGGTSVHRRGISEGTVNSVNPPEWWEKTHTLFTSDPFTGEDEDDIALLEHKHGGTSDVMMLDALGGVNAEVQPAARPRGGRNDSEDDLSYTDPFKDQEPGGSDVDVHGYPSISKAETSNRLRPVSASIVSSHRSSVGLASLPPLTTVQSNAASDLTTSHSSSQEHPNSPFSTLQSSSHSSHDLAVLSRSSSTRPRTTSIIGASSALLRPVRRSDSWWTRFKRTSFRERDSFHDPAKAPTFEFRDPNPAPGLKIIHEASLSQSNSPDSPTEPSSVARNTSIGGRGRRERIYTDGGGEHKRSLSSLQTARTVDSEAIDRIARRMDVTQRIGSMSSHQTYPSSSGGSVDSPDLEFGEAQYDPAEHAQLSDGDSRDTILDNHGNARVASPVQGEAEFGTLRRLPALDLPSLPHPAVQAQRPPLPRRPTSGGAVAARVAEYERRMSQDIPSPVSPIPPIDPEKKRHKTGGSVSYGLVQRPELFVANPDRRKVGKSSDS